MSEFLGYPLVNAENVYNLLQHFNTFPHPYSTFTEITGGSLPIPKLSQRVFQVRLVFWTDTIAAFYFGSDLIDSKRIYMVMNSFG